MKLIVFQFHSHLILFLYQIFSLFFLLLFILFVIIYKIRIF